VPAHLDYRSKRIADFEIDEIVEDKFVVELKEIQTDFLPDNYAQIITYLKLTNLISKISNSIRSSLTSG
jgi:hypothetical protein